jgi:tetratricopeptide (TPR) repeat protein
VDREPRLAFILVLCAVTAACCGAFQSPEDKYKKEMECASRITSSKSVDLLQRGMFCCAPLPKGCEAMPEARKYYFLRAWGWKPDSSDAPLGVARADWDEGNYGEALRYFDAARERSMAPLTAIIGEVTMYRLLKNYEPAHAWCRWLRVQKSIDGEKVSAYLTARLLYDEGRLDEAGPLFRKALERADKGSGSLGDTPFTMKDTHFYLAQILRKSGDPQGAHQQFLLYLKSMSDPDFQLAYKYWVEKFASDQATLYDTIEREWARIRQ